MVLEALRFATRGDSATSRPSLRNGSITSFFSPLPVIARDAAPTPKAEPLNTPDTQLNSIERLGRSSETASRPQQVAKRPSTPPSSAAAHSDTKKRKTTPRQSNVAQNRSSRNGAATRHNEYISSQAPAAKPDTKVTESNGPVKTSQETRTLRSKEKALFKSDLAMYFGNYEEILMDTAPSELEFLRVDEPIHLIDEPSKGSASSSPVKGKTATLPARTRAPSISNATPTAPSNAKTIQSPGPSQSQNDAKTIHLQSPTRPDEDVDPLSDDIYSIYHKRAERKEKQLRNIEKERAQHEKAHLERLLEGLQGPDWLRVLGVTGVTEGEQKEWKPKRDYFIKEVSELVDKFRRWKDAERRLRMKKEREREAEMDEDEDEGAESDASAGADSSDLDARAAYQLLQEAGQTPKATPRKKRAQHVLYEAPLSPEQPFAGFYKDPHIRAQAMGEVRHGRHSTAFGVDLPDPPEEEFELWPDWTTHDSRRARDRKRRKLKNEPEEKREFL